MAIAHFALGATLTLLGVALVRPNVRYPRTVVLAGGVWAIVPDVHWVSPIARETLREVHQTSILTDLFWFHRTLDALDPWNSRPFAAVLVGVLLLTSAVTEWRDRD